MRQYSRILFLVPYFINDIFKYVAPLETLITGNMYAHRQKHRHLVN